MSELLTGITLSRNPRKDFLLAGTFALLGLFIGARENPGGMMLLLVGSAFFVGAILRRNDTLRMDAAGLTYRYGFRAYQETWDDIESFGVMTMRHMGIPIRRMVGFRYAPQRQLSMMKKCLRMINGFDVLLPDTYGAKAKDLAEMLERYRLLASASQAADDERSDDDTGEDEPSSFAVAGRAAIR